MDIYHTFQVMCLFLSKGSDIYSGDLWCFEPLLDTEVGLDSADPTQS